MAYPIEKMMRDVKAYMIEGGGNSALALAGVADL